MLKLQYRIALFQFLVGSLIVVLGLIAHNQYAIKTARQEAKNSLVLLSREVAFQVDSLLQEKSSKVKVLTSAPVVETLLQKSNAEYSFLSQRQRDELISNLNQQWMETEDKSAPFIQKFLNNSVAHYLLKQFELNPEEYGEIFLTNQYGALVASTEKLTTFAHGHKYWWKAAYNNGLGKIFFDDRGFDASVKGYVLGIVVPVKKDGQIIGILKANVRIQGVLSKIVDESSTKFRQIVIARDGGAVVLQPGHEPLSTKLNSAIQTKLDNDQAGALSFDAGAVPSFSGFSPVLLSHGTKRFSFGGNLQSITQHNGNKGEGWHIVVTESQSNALRLSQQSARYFYRLSLFMVIVLAAIALWVGRRISAPLAEFSAAAAKVGRGDFNVRLNASTRDEFGDVARALNSMSDNLAKTMATKEEYALEIEKRKQAERALKNSNKRLNEAQRIAKIGSWQLDLTTNTLSWSDEIYRIFNLVPQQFSGTYEGFLENIHPEDRELVDRAYQNSLKEKKPYNVVHRLLLSDGTLKYVRECCETTYSDTGQAVRSLGTVQDITEGVLAEAEQRKLEEQLRQKHKMEAIGYMAEGIAHNFNNNLSIILGNVQLANLNVENPDINKMLQNAQIAIERSRDLIQKIITYGRGGEYNKVLTPLLPIVDETITLLQGTLPASIRLTRQFSPESSSITIKADPSQLQEVLLNLINNAVHAMNEKGELKLQLEPVELSTEDIPMQYEVAPGQYAKLSVQDTGHGIPAEIVENIFDPFFTTKGEHEGAGMGLATVHGIIAQHEGFIKVSSAPGKGTIFDVYLPIVDAKATVPISTNTELPRGTERILFIDDEEQLASLGETLLSKLGYQVVAMTSSTEALKLFTANSERIDLVITDQTMPKLCGDDLIIELKKIKSNLPIIICTGYSSKFDAEKVVQLGASGFLLKPLGLPELAQSVRRVLDEKKG